MYVFSVLNHFYAGILFFEKKKKKKKKERKKGVLLSSETCCRGSICNTLQRAINNSLKCVEKKNQLDATEWSITLIICSTCFGYFYAHHQDLKTICITAYGVRCLGCWLLEGRYRAVGYAFGMRDVGRLSRATSLIPDA